MQFDFRNSSRCRVCVPCKSDMWLNHLQQLTVTYAGQEVIPPAGVFWPHSVMKSGFISVPKRLLLKPSASFAGSQNPFLHRTSPADEGILLAPHFCEKPCDFYIISYNFSFYNITLKLRNFREEMVFWYNWRFRVVWKIEMVHRWSFWGGVNGFISVCCCFRVRNRKPVTPVLCFSAVTSGCRYTQMSYLIPFKAGK